MSIKHLLIFYHTCSILFVINVNHFVYWENSYFFAKVSNGKYLNGE